MRARFSAGLQGSKVKIQRTLLPIAAVIFVVALGADAPNAEETSSSKLSPQVLQEIAQVEAEIDRIAAQAIERLGALPGNHTTQIAWSRHIKQHDNGVSA